MTDYWSLRYAGVDVSFTDESGVFLREHPTVGDPDRAVDDSANARADGAQFGADYIAGRTIGLSFGVDGATAAEARARYDALAEIWRADAIRQSPGEVAELVAASGRSAFGRPRRFAPSQFRLEHTPPAIDIEADFATIDDLWYGDEDFITVPLGLTQGGGLVSPLKSPLVARGYTTAQNAFVVTGARATWPVVVIRGPILNPAVVVAGAFRFAAATSLAYDEWLTIDTRPGRQSVTRNDVKSAALTRSSTLLPAASLPVGSHTMTLSGSAASGAPTALLTWRPAYTTP